MLLMVQLRVEDLNCLRIKLRPLSRMDILTCRQGMKRLDFKFCLFSKTSDVSICLSIYVKVLLFVLN